MSARRHGRRSVVAVAPAVATAMTGTVAPAGAVTAAGASGTMA